MLPAVVALALSAPGIAGATTFLVISLATGDDDLRGGNRAFLTMILNDGTVLPERPLVSSDRGLRARSTEPTRAIRFTQNIEAWQIREFRIRHDGRPRAGHPFDTYDNWDLQAVRIVVRQPRGCFLGYDSAVALPTRALVHRFTGESPEVHLPRGSLLSVPC